MKKLLFFLPFLLFSKEITLDYLTSKPRSIPKDYYIWRFLDQNITPVEAQKAIEQTRYVNKKIFFRYAKKIKNPEIERIAQCLRMDAQKLCKQEPSCIAASLSPYTFLQLPKNEQKKLYNKLRHFPKIEKEYRFLLSKHPVALSMKEPQKYLWLFTRCGSYYRKSKFNFWLPQNFLKKLSDEKGFSTFLHLALTEDLKNIELSLLKLPPQYLNASDSFKVALIALKYHRNAFAIPYLQRALKKAYYQSHKDRAAYWLYHITKNRTYLDRLLNSWDLNIYTLLAYEMVHKPYRDFCTVKTFGTICDINASDPFVVWQIDKRLKEGNLTKLKKRFQCDNIDFIYANIVEKESRYRIHPFVMPYENLLQNTDTNTKALLYALAKQESKFYPGSISRSFALGPLQFMPFLAKATAKKRRIKNFDLDMMFNEKIAVSFALDHIRYLQKRLDQNPLLIAYAYNGGYGYTKRKIFPLFQKYDAMLAMELISYEETKEYGKKVLANYYVYRYLLQKPITLRSVLKRATLFLRTHQKR
ncbi:MULTISPECIES: lytic transglycosylase domain-containing protein [unclassified Nitratiruptor]|uniref:lytic transglycosylase domain-containing protein n=1 Tax=unclassified Nitratiruptor TaxID=2624044 RepID=UPI001916B40E|nr:MULTISPECIES: lytic transglycosylase domain-containing protein [unclassified Nitratiruptor]BCD60481.1 soluble lytic murein transglycosylase [Nitratiruptor sp. YY08-10]BCD64030.1 soluble lytic murein transglycosylase [Nitratiruptor sp. YY08-14]